MIKTSLKGIVLLSILTFVFTCKPNTDKEKKRWAENNANISTYMQRFPEHSDILKKVRDDAQVIWTQAKGMKDGDKKAEKMAEANKKINNAVTDGMKKFMELFYSCDKKFKQLHHLRQRTGSYSKDVRARMELQKAQKKYARARDTIKQSSGKDKTAVVAAFKEANKELAEVEKGLNGMIKKLGGKKKHRTGGVKIKIKKKK